MAKYCLNGFFFQIGKLVFQNSRCIMILYLHVIFYDFLPLICILQYYYMIDASVVFHTCKLLIGLLSVVLFDFLICVFFFNNLDNVFQSCIKMIPRFPRACSLLMMYMLKMTENVIVHIHWL